MNLKQLIIEEINAVDPIATVEKFGFEANPSKTSKIKFSSKKNYNYDKEHPGALRLADHLKKTGWKSKSKFDEWGGSDTFTHPVHGSINFRVRNGVGYTDQIEFNPKRTPVGTKTLGPGGIKGAVHNFLNDQGYEQTKNDISQGKGRYVKKGFYDGDFPNAHQTNIHSESHEFTKVDKTGEHYDNLHKELTDYGFKHFDASYDNSRGGKKDVQLYDRGDHRVGVYRDKGKLRVTHNFQTVTPDHEYTRSGKGIGQII